MEKRLVLIAEDDDDNFFYLRVSIKAFDFNIIRAKNGREAVQLVKDNKDVSLVLMDLKMPGMDGYEATRQIKEINPALPVVAVTAYALAGDEMKTIKAGCDAYISKPFSRESILEVIGKYLNLVNPS